MSELILPKIEGLIYGSTKPRQWSRPNVGVKYIKSVNVLNTGIDIPNIFWTPLNGNLDGSQYRVKTGDIVMNKSGTGTFGRITAIVNSPGKMVVSQDTMRIRIQNINIFYVVVYFLSKFGVNQIDRVTSGVSGQVHIDFDDIRSIKIPLIPDNIQQNIEAEYKIMHVYHERAMKYKKEKKDNLYQKNISTAEQMLKELIQKTEEVIEGKRKDVI